MLKFWKKKPAEDAPAPAVPAETAPGGAAAPAAPEATAETAAGADPVFADEARADAATTVAATAAGGDPSAATSGEAAAPPAPAPADPPAPAKRSWRERLSGSGFARSLSSLFVRNPVLDDAFLDELETCLISADVGVATATDLIEKLRRRVDKREFADANALLAALRGELVERLKPVEKPLDVGGRKPFVLLMVGVNGVGKTTSIGKLATKWNAEGKKVILGAGDTFRAAAVQQLEVWGKRVGADVVKGKEGADPGAVAFEATKKAQESGADILLVDTAGRLHTKVNLMDEIKKVKRTIAKAFEGAPHETLLVIDATTGQNALQQATLFKEALELTGIILTKLDGTAKGGVVLGVCDELKVPVKYIGLGERAEDLREFVAADFVEALFGKDDDDAAAA